MFTCKHAKHKIFHIFCVKCVKCVFLNTIIFLKSCLFAYFLIKI
nr:MAG TPA: hypothetical protein [Caudoviricetes sp.]